MFRELERAAEAAGAVHRQRDGIVERCLPLADHIARRSTAVVSLATIWCRSPGSVW